MIQLIAFQVVRTTQDIWAVKNPSLISISDCCLRSEVGGGPKFNTESIFATWAESNHSVVIHPTEGILLKINKGPSLGYPQYQHSGQVVLPDGSIFVSAGKNSDSHIYSQGVFNYHPFRGKLRVLCEVQKPRLCHLLFYIHGSIFFLGGNLFDKTLAKTQFSRLCLKTNTWKELSNNVSSVVGTQTLSKNSSCIFEEKMIFCAPGKIIYSIDSEGLYSCKSYKAIGLQSWKSNCKGNYMFNHDETLHLFFRSKKGDYFLLKLNLKTKVEGVLLNTFSRTNNFSKMMYAGSKFWMMNNPIFKKISYFSLDDNKLKEIDLRIVDSSTPVTKKAKNSCNYDPERGIALYSSKNNPNSSQGFAYFIDERFFSVYD